MWKDDIRYTTGQLQAPTSKALAVGGEQLTECHSDENWCDLPQDEQILLYCEQYEHQINSRDWAICE